VIGVCYTSLRSNTTANNNVWSVTSFSSQWSMRVWRDWAPVNLFSFPFFFFLSLLTLNFIMTLVKSKCVLWDCICFNFTYNYLDCYLYFVCFLKFFLILFSSNLFLYRILSLFFIGFFFLIYFVFQFHP